MAGPFHFPVGTRVYHMDDKRPFVGTVVDHLEPLGGEQRVLVFYEQLYYDDWEYAEQFLFVHTIDTLRVWQGGNPCQSTDSGASSYNNSSKRCNPHCERGG